MSLTQYSPSRVLAVTVGLSVSGAVFGGIAGAAAITAVVAIDGPALWVAGDVLGVAIVGAILGAVCAPLAGWLLLRRVPLGHAFVRLTIGTVIGGVLGWFLPWTALAYLQPVVAAGLGFLTAAVILRTTYVRTQPHDSAPSDAA